jgi:arabinofuranosyltransferase
MKNIKKDTALMLYLLLAFYTLLVLRSAWVSDDAIITFRVVENFLAGYGLGYNPFVRVQVFTHPLWMFSISFVYLIERMFIPSIPNALFYVTSLLSVVFSALALFFLLTKISKQTVLSFILTVLTLSLSNSFIDYSTSGLENPLTHFLLILFVIVFIAEKPNLLHLSFIASLVMLNRIDAFVLVAPALLFAWWVSTQRKSNLIKIFVGFIPIILWELFSLLYFGFLFPNTAYAKLSTGVADGALLLQGLDYLLNSINWDPIVFFTIGFAGVLLYLEKNWKLFCLYVGIFLYIAYIVKIGGDFMGGRFLTAPLILAVAILANQLTTKRIQLVSLCVVVLLGVFSFRSPLWTSNAVLYLPNYPISDRNDVTDQRMHYFGNDRKGQFNSFIENGFRDKEIGSKFAGSEWQFTGFESVYIADALGKPGYGKGPNIFVLDNFALSDPILARLTAAEDWSPGHFRREIPEGYVETLETGQNQITDPNLSLYYSKLQILITGRIWHWSRIVEIWKFNTGQYNYLLDEYNATQSK